MDKDTFGQDFEGKAEVNLREEQEITEQKKTIVWRELTDENGNGGRGQIKLQIHWIYSRFRYFDGLAQTWGEALHADKEELERTEADLAQMEKPFGFLATLKSLAIYDAEDDKSDDEEDPDSEKAAAAQLAKDTFKSESMKAIVSFCRRSFQFASCSQNPKTPLNNSENLKFRIYQYSSFRF